MQNQCNKNFTNDLINIFSRFTYNDTKRDRCADFSVCFNTQHRANNRQISHSLHVPRDLHFAEHPTLFTAPCCLITFSLRRFYNSPHFPSLAIHTANPVLRLACEIKKSFQRSHATRDVRIWKTLMKMRDKLLKILVRT